MDSTQSDGSRPTPCPELTRDLVRFATGLVKHKVTPLVRTGVLREHETEDLVQDILLQLHVQYAKLNLERGRPEALIMIVVHTRTASWLRQHAGQRLKRPGCLDDSKEPFSRSAGPGTLAEDVHDCIKGLPMEDQELCRLLSKESVSEVARQLKIPRGTLRGRIEQIALAMRKRSLDQYL